MDDGVQHNGRTIYFPEIVSVATLMGPCLLGLRKKHTDIIFPKNLSQFGPRTVDVINGMGEETTNCAYR